MDISRRSEGVVGESNLTQPTLGEANKFASRDSLVLHLWVSSAYVPYGF